MGKALTGDVVVARLLDGRSARGVQHGVRAPYDLPGVDAELFK